MEKWPNQQEWEKHIQSVLKSKETNFGKSRSIDFYFLLN